jgi:hypothetical protein
MPSSALFYPVLQDKREMKVPEIPPPVTELCSLHTGPHLRVIIVLRCFTVICTKRRNGPGERVNHQTRNLRFQKRSGGKQVFGRVNNRTNFFDDNGWNAVATQPEPRGVRSPASALIGTGTLICFQGVRGRCLLVEAPPTARQPRAGEQ